MTDCNDEELNAGDHVIIYRYYPRSMGQDIAREIINTATVACNDFNDTRHFPGFIRVKVQGGGDYYRLYERQQLRKLTLSGTVADLLSKL